MADARIQAPPPPHSARRTTISLLTAAGVPSMVIQRIAGHARLDQTYDYVSVPRDQLEEGLSRLAAMYATAAAAEDRARPLA